MCPSFLNLADEKETPSFEQRLLVYRSFVILLMDGKVVLRRDAQIIPEGRDDALYGIPSDSLETQSRPPYCSIREIGYPMKETTAVVITTAIAPYLNMVLPWLYSSPYSTAMEAKEAGTM